MRVWGSGMTGESPCRHACAQSLPGLGSKLVSECEYALRRPAAVVPANEKKGGDVVEESESLLNQTKGSSDSGGKSGTSPPNGRTNIRSSSSSDLKAKEFV